MKTCSLCRSQKLDADFYTRSDRPGTFRPRCRECMSTRRPPRPPRETGDTKVCSRCRVEKPTATEFHPRPDVPGGFRSACKACMAGRITAPAGDKSEPKGGLLPEVRFQTPLSPLRVDLRIQGSRFDIPVAVTPDGLILWDGEVQGPPEKAIGDGDVITVSHEGGRIVLSSRDRVVIRHTLGGGESFEWERGDGSLQRLLRYDHLAAAIWRTPTASTDPRRHLRLVTPHPRLADMLQSTTTPKCKR